MNLDLDHVVETMIMKNVGEVDYQVDMVWIVDEDTLVVGDIEGTLVAEDVEGTLVVVEDTLEMA